MTKEAYAADISEQGFPGEVAEHIADVIALALDGRNAARPMTSNGSSAGPHATSPTTPETPRRRAPGTSESPRTSEPSSRRAWARGAPPPIPTQKATSTWTSRHSSSAAASSRPDSSSGLLYGWSVSVIPGTRRVRRTTTSTPCSTSTEPSSTRRSSSRSWASPSCSGRAIMQFRAGDTGGDGSSRAPRHLRRRRARRRRSAATYPSTTPSTRSTARIERRRDRAAAHVVRDALEPLASTAHRRERRRLRPRRHGCARHSQRRVTVSRIVCVAIVTGRVARIATQTNGSV